MSETEASLRIIGALASDIRGDWSNYGDVNKRLYAMVNLSIDIQREDLIDWIEEHRNEIYSDGRTFRDWPGPYGTCTQADLKLIDLPDFMFSCPDRSINCELH